MPWCQPACPGVYLARRVAHGKQGVPAHALSAREAASSCGTPCGPLAARVQSSSGLRLNACAWNRTAAARVPPLLAPLTHAPRSAAAAAHPPPSAPPQEFSDVTAYLLWAYQSSGKTFIFQNWEGDWSIRHGTYNASQPPTPAAIANMKARPP
jgi:hypothetical protein